MGGIGAEALPLLTGLDGLRQFVKILAVKSKIMQNYCFEALKTLSAFHIFQRLCAEKQVQTAE